MYTCNQEKTEGYRFQFLHDLKDPPVQLMVVGLENRCLSSYYYDNKNRQSAYLFQYTLDGSGFVQIDGKKFTISKGQAFFLRLPGKECYYFDEKADSHWRFFYVTITGKTVDAFYESMIFPNHRIFNFPQFNPVEEMLQGLFLDARNGKLSNPFITSSRAYSLLCCICESCYLPSGQYSHLVGRAKEYIKANYGQPVDISEIAAQLHVSHSHLSRQFSKETGMTPIAYLGKVRIEKATHLLVTTTMRVDEVAAVCGFSDGNYFDKVFRKFIHMSPRAFREHAALGGYQYLKL